MTRMLPASEGDSGTWTTVFADLSGELCAQVGLSLPPQTATELLARLGGVEEKGTLSERDQSALMDHR